MSEEMDMKSLEEVDDLFNSQNNLRQGMNIAKAFTRFINSRGDRSTIEAVSGVDGITYENVKTQYEQFKETRKYSLAFVVEVMRHSVFKNVFFFFLGSYALKWLAARIKTIESLEEHIITIYFFRLC